MNVIQVHYIHAVSIVFVQFELIINYKNNVT
jgi:hypothetical protein